MKKRMKRSRSWLFLSHALPFVPFHLKDLQVIKTATRRNSISSKLMKELINGKNVSNRIHFVRNWTISSKDRASDSLSFRFLASSIALVHWSWTRHHSIGLRSERTVEETCCDGKQTKGQHAGNMKTKLKRFTFYAREGGLEALFWFLGQFQVSFSILVFIFAFVLIKEIFVYESGQDCASNTLMDTQSLPVSTCNVCLERNEFVICSSRQELYPQMYHYMCTNSECWTCKRIVDQHSKWKVTIYNYSDRLDAVHQGIQWFRRECSICSRHYCRYET